MKINILKSEVYNQIAAGEVVEKPFNVVKELVENSIDAGATEIKIEILNGGIDLIRITDNGCGIDREEIGNAFASHATSKITQIEDLQKIFTLGFRGEALSSIASVSKINLKTKTQNSKFGTEAINIGGTIIGINDVGMFNGSIFEITDLFYNFPARKKFLKNPKQEESDITDYVERLILSHPQISFTFIINNKIIYSFKQSDLENAIFTIFGKEVYENIIPINAKQNDNSNIKLFGYIGKPKIAKSNKKAQSLFINGRYVKNETIYSAVNRVYENYLMKGKYPFYVINLSIPGDLIDVNVHPTKQEIRFQNPSEIFSFVYKSLSEALLNANRFNIDDALASEVFYHKKPINSNNTELKTIENTSIKETKCFNDLFKLSDEIKLASPNDNVDKFFQKDYVFNNKIKTEENQDINSNNINFKIVGTIFKTYIIVENGENVYFIDQHAAHERLLFNKLVEFVSDKDNQPKQQLLMPFITTLSYAQNEIFEKNIDVLKLIGLNFEMFGKNTYKLNELPLCLSNLNIANFLNEFFDNTNKILCLKTDELIKDKLATIACKSAVKAGSQLSEDQILDLLNQIKSTKCVLLCPHGRPILISYSKKDFEKWFKRIV